MTCTFVQAASWADHRKVTQIAFKPDWKLDGNAAPFKRDDRMLAIVPDLGST